VPVPDFITDRTLWKSNGLLNLPWREDDGQDGRTSAAPGEANLVGSQTTTDPPMHMPVLDIDFPAHLEPSTTPGHFHLYLNKAITWEKFRALLTTLRSVGIIEEGYYEMALKRGQTFVRYPGIKKLPGEEGGA
jgi:hypothetical protein